MTHLLIPCIYLLDGRAVTGFGQKTLLGDGDPVSLARFYGDSGADFILVFDFSDSDRDHDRAVDCIRDICRASQVPVAAAGNIRRVEDVKKILYAGCSVAVLNGSRESNMAMLGEVSKRFGKEKISVRIPDFEVFQANRKDIETYAGSLLISGNASAFAGRTETPVVLHLSHTDEEGVRGILREGAVTGITGGYVSDPATDLSQLKAALRRAGLPMKVLVSAVPWSDFKKDAAGLVPCIVQDFKNDEVLMMAWMNEESFERTLDTGRMTYYSRSRRSLWTKGETSGHFQYVKSLSIDCDRDTMLARVIQVGAACHTGNRSCFYTPLVDRGGNDTNPYRVFEKEMNTILERKEHPKEGSYTNYLFDKGIDKILKKVGEENTEIIIAAKNPNPEEIKYEISDYLYHLMVLMAERGVTWEDVTEEIARR